MDADEARARATRLADATGRIEVDGGDGAAAGARTRSRNVRVCLYLFLARAVQAAIGTQDFLDIYLFDISGTNELVGKVESARGIASLIMLLPMGLLADRCGRQKLLRCIAVAKAFPVAAAVAGVSTDNLMLLWPSLVMLAVADQSFDQVLQVVVVDSVLDAAGRSRILSRKEALTWGGRAVGPLLAMLVIFTHASSSGGGGGASGGEPSGWSLSMVRSIVLVGLSSFIVVEPAVLFLRRGDAPAPAQGQACAGGAGAGAEEEAPAWTEAKVCGVRKRWLLPVWTDVSWAVIQLGGSISLRYLSLFFRRDFGLSPTALMLFRFLENAMLAGMTSLTPPITRALGRGWAAIMFTLGGAALMVCGARASVAWLAVTLFVLRTAVCRANVPCIQAIIFECVAKRHRGTWSAVTSFKSASNGAGAWVGGYLADRTGDYRAAFVLTGILQATGALALAPVALWLPRGS